MKSEAKRVGRSGLLLTETLIAILFFSIASAICIQLFAKTHTLSRTSQALSLAVNQTASVSELISHQAQTSLSYEDVAPLITEYYPRCSMTAQGIEIYFTDDGSVCEKRDAKFLLSVKPEGDWTAIAPCESASLDFSLSLTDLMADPDSKRSCVYEMELNAYCPRTKEVSP